MRKKNALTEYYVGESGAEAALRLAHRITEVNDNSDETTEDYADYAGDGTVTTDVTGVRKGYDFVGQFDVDDPAMAFIGALEITDGDERTISFKQIRTDGRKFEGEAVVTGIVTTGGAAQDYAPFNCTIAWKTKPTITLPAPVEP